MNTELKKPAKPLTISCWWTNFLSRKYTLPGMLVLFLFKLVTLSSKNSRKKIKLSTVVCAVAPSCWKNSSSNSSSSNSWTKAVGILINLSLQQGTFPSKLKVAEIFPLYKKGDANSIINYRPITLCSSMSKVFEIIVNKQLVDYLARNNFLSKN